MTNAQLATRLHCTPRTVQNIRARGFDPADPLQVGTYLANVRCPSLEMLRANADELQSLEKKLLRNIPPSI